MTAVFKAFGECYDISDMIADQVYRDTMSDVFKDIKNFVGFNQKVHYMDKRNTATFFYDKITGQINTLWVGYFAKNLYLQSYMLDSKLVRSKYSNDVILGRMNDFLDEYVKTSSHDYDMHDFPLSSNEMVKEWAANVSSYHMLIKIWGDEDDYEPGPFNQHNIKYHYDKLDFYKRQHEKPEWGENWHTHSQLQCDIQSLEKGRELRMRNVKAIDMRRYAGSEKNQIVDNLLVYMLRYGEDGDNKARKTEYWKELCKWNGITIGSKSKIQMIRALIKLEDNENPNDRYDIKENDYGYEVRGLTNFNLSF